jgi:hypothetical protein
MALLASKQCPVMARPIVQARTPADRACDLDQRTVPDVVLM